MRTYKIDASESFGDRAPLPGAYRDGDKWKIDIEETDLATLIASSEDQVTVMGDTLLVLPYDDYVE